METLHTPGPWEANHYGDDNGERKWVVYPKDGPAITLANAIPSLDDAALIAAAPAMLAALESIAATIEPFYGEDESQPECFDMMRAAIAQARGEG